MKLSFKERQKYYKEFIRDKKLKFLISIFAIPAIIGYIISLLGLIGVINEKLGYLGLFVGSVFLMAESILNLNISIKFKKWLININNPKINNNQLSDK